MAGLCLAGLRAAIGEAGYAFVPAREMLGALLLDTSRPAQALAQFRATLARHPNRFWTLHGAAQAAKRAGDAAAARSYFTQLLSIAPRADEPRRAALVEAREGVKGD